MTPWQVHRPTGADEHDNDVRLGMITKYWNKRASVCMHQLYRSRCLWQ